MARDDGNDIEDFHEELPPREVTLSTSAILGLFFALALICAAFFGFGYTVGRKSIAAPEPNPNAPVADTYKPPAGSPAIQAVPGYLTAQQAADANKNANDDKIYAPPQPTPAQAKAAAAAAARNNEPAPAAAAPVTPTPPANITAVNTRPTPAPIVTPMTPSAPASTPASAAPAAATNSYVQIAAFSREDDADLVLKALRSRGYAVNPQPQSDHLIHLMMGPFTTRKDAETMRQRLLADGYNAIVK